jgi:hypothetical protein
LQSGAFLMELGKLGTSLTVIESGHADEFSQDIIRGMSIESVEKQYVEMSSYEIAASMFERWNFETALVEALREISNPLTDNRYAQVLRVVTQAVNIRNPFGDVAMAEAFESIEAFGLNRSLFEEALQSVKSHLS